MDHLPKLVAAALLLAAAGAHAQTYQVGQYMGNLTEAQRLAYYASGSNAQAAFHAKYTPGAAYLGTANGVRMTGTAAANIGGRSVALTMASRIPYGALATAARGVSMLTPASAAVTLLGFAAMQGWLTSAGLEWNTDGRDNVEKPFLKRRDECNEQGCPEYSAWPSLPWVPSPTQACQDFFTIANQAYDYELISAQNAECRYRTRLKGSSEPMQGNFVQGYSTRYVQGSVELQKYTWEQAMPDLSSPTNYGAIDWKSITEQLLSKGGSIPRAEVRDQNVSGPSSQSGQRTERTLSNGDKQVTQTTHNYTYNNANNSSSVTHNTTTTTTTTNINNEIVNEETETTENKPPEEPPPDLCEKNPDILACQKLGEPQTVDLETQERDATITPESGFGGAGQCPAPRYIYPQGRTIPIPFDLFCTYAEGLWPVIIALAWLSAGFILMGARGGD